MSVSPTWSRESCWNQPSPRLGSSYTGLAKRQEPPPGLPLRYPIPPWVLLHRGRVALCRCVRAIRGNSLRSHFCPQRNSKVALSGMIEFRLLGTTDGPAVSVVSVEVACCRTWKCGFSGSLFLLPFLRANGFDMPASSQCEPACFIRGQERTFPLKADIFRLGFERPEVGNSLCLQL